MIANSHPDIVRVQSQLLEKLHITQLKMVHHALTHFERGPVLVLLPAEAFLRGKSYITRGAMRHERYLG